LDIAYPVNIEAMRFRAIGSGWLRNVTEMTSEALALTPAEILRVLTISLLVAFAACAGMNMVGSKLVSAFWPANGLLLAFILTAPRRHWPIYLLAGAIANVVVHRIVAPVEYGLWDAVQISIANAIEITVAAWPFRKTAPLRPDLTQIAVLRKFVLFGCILGPSAFGLWVMMTTRGPFYLYAFAIRFRLWMMADCVGIALTTPLMLALLDPAIVSLFRGWRLLETFALEFLMAATAVFIFRGIGHPYPLLVLLVLIPVVFRLGLPGAALGMLMVAIIAIHYTFAGQGLFAQRFHFLDWSLMVQGYCVLLLAMIYGIAAVLGKQSRLEAELRTSESRYRVLAETSQDLILRTTLEGAPTYASPSIQRVCGWTAEQLIAHRALPELVHPEDRARMALFLNSLISGSETGSLVYRCKDRSGGYAWLEAYIGIVFNEAGEPDELVWTIRDISSRVAQAEMLKSEKERAEELAQTDSLTGLYNRRAFDDRYSQAFRQARQSRLPMSLLLMDADYFKSYNDTYGHQKGDECLRQIATVIGECIRQSVDIAARYGGEEFAVVLPNADMVRAQEVAERIRERVAGLDMRHTESEAGWVTLSIGIACAPTGYGHDADALIASADRALYAAKRGGRNRVELVG